AGPRPGPPRRGAGRGRGRGRAVTGGAAHTPLPPADVRRVIFEGFFPKTPRDAMPARGARTGLHEMGLPYVSDPAITRHLAEFLSRHAPAGDRPEADAILFNGGVFQPDALREHLLEVMHGWYDAPKKAWKPLVMTTPSLDLAVALGAAYFGWLKPTGGRRIGGGMARSYYLAVQGAAPAAEGKPGVTVLCVVPQHLEEGHEIALEKPEL